MTTTTMDQKNGPTAHGDVPDLRRLSRRIAVGISLAGVAAIHVLDLPGKMGEVPYLGVAYILVILASLILVERLFTVGARIDFLAAAALAAAVIVGFVINRTVGLPGATDDIGNWLEPLGLLSLLVEGFVVWQALAAVVNLRRGGR